MTDQRQGITTELTSKQRILERTIQVIEEGGEVSIRTNPIAFDCGVTPPILYRAFGSREGLIIAAQSERYRRSMEKAYLYLHHSISGATSRESLRDAVANTLDFIFSRERSESRRLRAEVIGSSVSRPVLREELKKIDWDYARLIADAFTQSIENGWISREKKYDVIVLWALGIVNSRYLFDDVENQEVRISWNQLSRDAIMTALLD